MNKQDKKVPTLRFKGFTNDWEQRKFDNVVKRINDKDDNPELPHIEFENIISGNGTLNKNIKDLNSKKIGTKFQKEDILFGKLRPYLKNWYFAKENGIAVGDFWVLRAKKISVFVYYLIQTEKFYSIANLSSGSKMPRSDWNLVSNSRFNFPENTIESIKIGNLILQLDKLITLQQRKLDLLKQLKKGLLQKMFADKGSKRPILRFEGFNNEWECKKLGDIARMYQPKTITSSKLASTGYPVFGANGYIGFYSEANHMDDQVTISARGEGTGTPSYVKGPVWITSNSMVINVDNSGIDKAFLFNNLSAHSLKKYVTGGAQPQLTREVLKGISIMLSGQNEQTKIGDLSKRLIKIISVQQNKLSKLKDVKKALLQQMFI